MQATVWERRTGIVQSAFDLAIRCRDSVDVTSIANMERESRLDRFNLSIQPTFCPGLEVLLRQVGVQLYMSPD